MRERRGSREARTLSSFWSREFRGLFISRALGDLVQIGGGLRIDSKGRSRAGGTEGT